MKILAIDTTAENLVVAYYSNNKIYSVIGQDGARKHNSVLLSHIDNVLSQANETIRDVECFGCVIGPGSFTGIRIGVSTIKGFCRALGKNAVGVTSLELLAYNVKKDDFYTAIDCGHDCSYVAHFFKSYDNIEKMEVVENAFLIDKDVVHKTGPSNIEDLISVIEEKAKKEEYSILEPFYLRKSQAERQREGD